MPPRVSPPVKVELVGGGGAFTHRWAIFDDTRTYRYSLRRTWKTKGSGVCCFVMLNPSTADETVLDPTVRRCVDFAQRWGFAALDVVNLFALRSTDPAALRAHVDPVGPKNDELLVTIAEQADLVVAAWGRHGRYRARDEQVVDLLGAAGVDLMCLGCNADGTPRHPLYLKKSAGVSLLRARTCPTCGQPCELGAFPECVACQQVAALKKGE
jgi:hypothetical protein